MDVDDWFLTPDERGNPNTKIDARRGDGRAWTEGNLVGPAMHGKAYFAELVRCAQDLGRGDLFCFTDWRGDSDETLADDTTLIEMLLELVGKGVDIRGLVWRSHMRLFGFNQEDHIQLADRVNEAGGEILLDRRVRRDGSHHQKLVVTRHLERPDRDVAFVGGIDLCHGRRDNMRHLGDPQPEHMDEAYGQRPPWHDVQVEVHGPAIGDLDCTFRERWNDPTPLADERTPWQRMITQRANQPEAPRPMADQPPDPPPAGRHAVQVLRTYPHNEPEYPFALKGERSIARAYHKAFSRARSLIYVEDQYLWSSEVADLYEEALRRAPELRLVVVVPRYPDRNGGISGPAHRVGQLEILDRLRRTAGDRVAVYDLENELATPVYVHAKVVVIDDVFAAIGSDNMNRRSWTHDSELSIGVIDDERDTREPADPGGLGYGARVFARELRLRLWREHLGRDDDEGLLDPLEGFEAWRRAAVEVESWHAAGRRGERPPGRVRPHRPDRLHPWQIWATPLYRTIVDPDGRPPELEKAGTF
jgi:phosphatidylserine/phosphatidylglycerophosphate/cardiolipin synthase-like enzyme